MQLLPADIPCSFRFHLNEGVTAADDCPRRHDLEIMLKYHESAPAQPCPHIRRGTDECVGNPGAILVASKNCGFLKTGIVHPHNLIRSEEHTSELQSPC